MRFGSDLLTSLASAIAAAISLLAFFHAAHIVAILSAGFAGIFPVYVSRTRQRLQKRKRIFIIYSHKDSEVAEKLIAWLRDDGFDPWYDRDEIAPGQRIEEALIDGLRHSAAALVLVSKNMAASSKYLALEINFALTSMRGKSDRYSPVIPVRLDDHPVPNELDGISGIQLTDDADFRRLARSLHFALGT